MSRGMRPDLGILILPLGRFLPFMMAPLIGGFLEGGVGAWMASICFIIEDRFGADCR